MDLPNSYVGDEHPLASDEVEDVDTNTFDGD